MTDTDRRDSASATKFVSSLTYLISVVNLAMKANCHDCRSDGRSVTDDITKLKVCGQYLRKSFILFHSTLDQN